MLSAVRFICALSEQLPKVIDPECLGVYGFTTMSVGMLTYAVRGLFHV
jgi:hypothetical protein